MGGAEIMDAQVRRTLPNVHQASPGVAVVTLIGRSGGRSGDSDSNRGTGDRGRLRRRGRGGAGAVQVGNGCGIGSDGLPRRSPRGGGNMVDSGTNY